MDNSGKLIGSPTAQLQAFAQSIYKLIKNRYYDDLTSVDGQAFTLETIDWLNEFIDELEFEVTPDGQPIDWIWVRRNVALGTATANANFITWDASTYNNLCAGTERFVQVLSPIDGVTPITNFTVVAPEEMSNDSQRNTLDMCTLYNGNIIFSRNFTTAENGGTIQADVTIYLPRVQTVISSTTGQVIVTNADIFKTVRPLTLLKLGTAKNAILPDIVKGGLQPSYVQKYNDLLANAINRSTDTSLSPTADYDDFGSVRGVGF